MNLGMTIQGVKEIERKLHKLETKDVSRIARTDSRSAQNTIMLPEIRGNAVGMVSGKMGALLASSMTVRAMTKMRRGSYGHKVVIKDKAAFVYESKDGTRSYIPNAIEYGHAAPYDAGGAKVSTAIPFQRKAYESKRGATAKKLANNMIRHIESAVRSK